MATLIWLGGALEVAQVTTWTLGGTWNSADTITVTVGRKSATFTTGSAVIANILTALATAYNALSGDTYPEQAEMAATAGSTTFTLTANTAGKPFTATITTNSALGTISAPSTTTASAGPEDASSVANYSTGALPVNGDTLVIDREGTVIRYNLGVLNGVTLAERRITAQDVEIGLPKTNVDGTAYPEYRDDYFRCGVTLDTINTQSGRIKLDYGAVQASVDVQASGRGDEQNVPAVLLKGTHASNVVSAKNCELGIAFFGEETATAATLRVNAGATVVCGKGVTLGTIDKSGGDLLVTSAIGTAINNLAGNTIINGTGAVAQINGFGGRITYNTSGTLNGNTVLSNPCVLDFNGDLRSKAVTNPIKCYGYSNVPVLDDYKVATGLVVDMWECTGGFRLGTHVRLTRGVPS